MQLIHLEICAICRTQEQHRRSRSSGRGQPGFRRTSQNRDTIVVKFLEFSGIIVNSEKKQPSDVNHAHGSRETRAAITDSGDQRWHPHSLHLHHGMDFLAHYGLLVDPKNKRLIDSMTGLAMNGQAAGGRYIFLLRNISTTVNLFHVRKFSILNLRMYFDIQFQT